jgi:hypothetical protein
LWTKRELNLRGPRRRFRYRRAPEDSSYEGLCPFFVPTGIHQSERARPDALRDTAPPTRSQLVSKTSSKPATPSDPFCERAELSAQQREALRGTR